MQPFPPLPDAADAPADLFDRGHLWLQEWVVGGPVRFRVDETGVTVGDGERVFEPWDEPPGYRHVARHVRERFDASTFLGEVSDPADHVFYGVATRDEGVAYDWDRLPSFLALDVHSPDRGFLAPDAVERAFDRLGLAPVNALRKEVAARDFHRDRFEVPGSAWYDGPAAGVVVRNKRGQRALVPNPACEVADVPPHSPDVEAIAETFLTADRIDRTVAEVGGSDAASVDRVLDRLVETLARERYRTVVAPGGFDAGAFRAAAAERVVRRLGR